jgi:hypothetical protein
MAKVAACRRDAGKAEQAGQPYRPHPTLPAPARHVFGFCIRQGSGTGRLPSCRFFHRRRKTRADFGIGAIFQESAIAGV